MALPYLISSGRWAYDFSFNGKRTRLRLGKMPGKRQADQRQRAAAFTGMVDQLCGQLATGGGLLPDQVRWLSCLDDRLHDRLATALPIQKRTVSTLGKWIDGYIERRTLSDGGRLKLEQTRSKLVTYFGEDRPLREISAADAEAWRDAMLKHLSIATTKTHCGNAKGIFREAVRKKLLAESPMEGLASGSTSRLDSQFVEREVILKVINALPTDQLELKLRLALCRFAGLRVDSEPKTLMWSNVDFANGRMAFFDQKRNRYRVCPIDEQLLPHLLARLAQRQGDEEQVCRVGKLNGRHKELIEQAINKAGVKRWSDLFQSLRASYDTEIRMSVGDAAADAIVGHTTTVARKHYNQNLPDSVFDKLGVKWDEKAAQKAAHSLRQSTGTEGHQGDADPRYSLKNGHQGESAIIEGNQQTWAIRDSNP